MVEEMIEILHKWQTLIGAILGGLFALAVALVVAVSVRRREEVASGMLVAANLTAVEVASEALADLANEAQIPEAEYPLWFSDRLLALHPSLSVLFESSLVRIMPVDTSMAAHLSLFHTIYTKVEVILARLSEDIKHFHEHGKTLRPLEHFEADARLVSRHFQRAVRHASCAGRLITRLILSRVSVWHRLRRRIWMKQEEKECLKLLREGSG